MKAIDYVKSVDLSGTPRHTQTIAQDGTAATVFDQAKGQAQVVGAGLFSFVPGVEAGLRVAISDSALLAQLVADKAAKVDGDPIKWFDAYIDVLKNLGWVLEGGAWNDYSAGGQTSEVHEKIIGVLGVILGPGAVALTIVTSALNALKAMNEGSPWITLFSRETQKAKIARFQVAVVDQNNTGGVTISLLACLIEAKTSNTQVLFFKHRSSEASFKANNTKVSMSNTALQGLAGPIRQKVLAYQTSYLSSIQDL
jgi:hypothetical protein